MPAATLVEQLGQEPAVRLSERMWESVPEGVGQEGGRVADTPTAQGERARDADLTHGERDVWARLRRECLGPGKAGVPQRAVAAHQDVLDEPESGRREARRHEEANITPHGVVG